MISQRIVVRRIGIVALVAAMLGVTLAIPVIGATGYVSGTLTFKEQIGLSGNAVAVITIVDQAAAKDAGAIVGQERIDGVGQVPIPFSVPYDPSRIDPKHPYGLFATIIDGAKSWQNPHGIAVLTGGPTEGVDAILSAVPGPAALISGTITKSDTSALGPAAVAIAALIKQETGTLVNRQVLPLNGQVPVSFTVGFDPSLIDPAATYVVKAAIVDGSEVWENRDGVVAISGGTPATKLSVPVIKAPAPIPVSSPFPTARPTATPQPSVGPSVVPTTSPSGTTRPSATATARPSGSPRPTPSGTPSPAPTASAGPTPTPTPSPSPTPSPTASLTPSPTPSPTPSSSPTPSPIPSPTATSANPTATPATGALTGTLTYVEPHKLSANAVAVVVLVSGTAKPNEGSIVATQVVQNPGSTPIDFRVVYENAHIDLATTYTLQAAVVDGADVWTTAKGSKVLTNGAPTSGIHLALAYQPDLIKGEVSGSMTGVGIQLSTTAYSVAVLIEPSTGSSIGIDVNPTNGTVPVPFAVPFSLDTIDPAKSYVVTGELVDGTSTWENTTGVPVITNGNAVSDVQVVVTPGAPSPTPVTSPAETGRGDISPAILLTIVALIVGAIGLYLWSRSRREPPPGPSSPGGSPPEPEAAPWAAAEPGAEAAEGADQNPVEEPLAPPHNSSDA